MKQTVCFNSVMYHPVISQTLNSEKRNIIRKQQPGASSIPPSNQLPATNIWPPLQPLRYWSIPLLIQPLIQLQFPFNFHAGLLDLDGFARCLAGRFRFHNGHQLLRILIGYSNRLDGIDHRF